MKSSPRWLNGCLWSCLYKFHMDHEWSWALQMENNQVNYCSVGTTRHLLRVQVKFVKLVSYMTRTKIEQLSFTSWCSVPEDMLEAKQLDSKAPAAESAALHLMHLLHLHPWERELDTVKTICMQLVPRLQVFLSHPRGLQEEVTQGAKPVVKLWSRDDPLLRHETNGPGPKRSAIYTA